jgi:hypothetical protein
MLGTSPPVSGIGSGIYYDLIYSQRSEFFTDGDNSL